jgi:hypothetical protein
MWSGPPACNGGVHTAAPGGPLHMHCIMTAHVMML